MEYSENELVLEIKKRNMAAYEHLIQHYTKSIYYLAYNILKVGGSKEDMEECVADVLFEVWDRIDEFDSGRGSFKTWVLILAKYRALHYKRKGCKVAELNIDDINAEEHIGVEKQVLDRHTQQKLIETINTFNKIDRELFIRRYFYNEKISDLMKTLELSRSAIDNRLLRGRKIIKEVLSYE